MLDRFAASLGPNTIAKTLVRPCSTLALPSGRCIDVPGKEEIPRRGASGEICSETDLSSSGNRPSSRSEPLFNISSLDMVK